MRRRQTSSDQAPESALARLLEVETRLEAMLEEVRTDAEAMVAAATARAEGVAESLGAELAAAEADLAADLEAEAATRVARACAEFEAGRAAIARVDEKGIDALAAWVVEAVLAEAGREER